MYNCAIIDSYQMNIFQAIYDPFETIPGINRQKYQVGGKICQCYLRKSASLAASDQFN